MNIIYIYRTDIPDTKPGTNFVMYTMQALAASNPNNMVYLIVDDIKDQESLKNILDKRYSLSLPDNFKIIQLSDRLLPNITTSFYISGYKKVNDLIKGNGKNIVITRTDGFLPFLARLSKKKGVKTFFEAHDFYLNKKRDKSYKKYFYHKYLLPKLDGIITHQNILKKLYSDALPEQKILMARTGIKDINNEVDSWKNNELIYIGSIDKRKRIKDLIIALNKIQNKNLRLKIVGGKSDKDIHRILSYAKSLCVENRLVITGWISQKEVINHLKNAKIGLIPLEDNYFNNYLTSPIKAFDYFSHTLPIISSDMPSTRDVISEECGLFYNNIEELVNAINQLDSDYNLYHDISKKIYNRAKNLLWSKRADRILEFFNSFE